MTFSILANSFRKTCNKCDFVFINSSMQFGHIILMVILCFYTCVAKQTFIPMSNNEPNLTNVNMYNILSYYRVNISNDYKAEPEKIVFLNSKLKQMLEEHFDFENIFLLQANCIFIKKMNIYPKIRLTTFNNSYNGTHNVYISKQLP